jgi:hypothetical protein
VSERQRFVFAVPPGLPPEILGLAAFGSTFFEARDRAIQMLAEDHGQHVGRDDVRLLERREYAS